jgi:hypothetical protein
MTHLSARKHHAHSFHSRQNRCFCWRENFARNEECAFSRAKWRNRAQRCLRTTLGGNFYNSMFMLPSYKAGGFPGRRSSTNIKPAAHQLAFWKFRFYSFCRLSSTRPWFLPKRRLHRERSNASCFIGQNPLVSIRPHIYKLFTQVFLTTNEL